MHGVGVVPVLEDEEDPLPQAHPPRLPRHHRRLRVVDHHVLVVGVGAAVRPQEDRGVLGGPKVYLVEVAQLVLADPVPVHERPECALVPEGEHPGAGVPGDEGVETGHRLLGPGDVDLGVGVTPNTDLRASALHLVKLHFTIYLKK